MRSPTSRRVPDHPARDARPTTDWIGLGDATLLLGVSPATLRRWSDQGRIPVFTTPGGHRRYSRRVLSALVARRRPRPSLAGLGASPERIARSYRPVRRTVPAPERHWLAALDEQERSGFRARGRHLVEELLLHLDAAEAGAPSEHLDRAIGIARDHGRTMARLGCSTVDAVETFLEFRAPFLAEMGRLAGRRGIPAEDATGLLSAVEAALDRLLVATIEGHAEGREDGATGDGAGRNGRVTP